MSTTRTCSICGKGLVKTEYSKNQWSKGDAAKCKGCVAENDVPPAPAATKVEAKKCLDASILPPFEPTKKVVQCANGPMSALKWAFTSCVPPMARMIFGKAGGASNDSLRANATPEMCWNYSMLHLAHHYESMPGLRNFVVTDEDDTAAILIEVTALRACPEDVDALPRSEFFDPQDKEKRIGALPIFFVRYFFEEKGKQPSWNPAAHFLQNVQPNGARKGRLGLMTITAASKEEINFGHQELQRGQSLLGKSTAKAGKKSSTKAGKFNQSVLFPTKITQTKVVEKAPHVCASCGTAFSGRLFQCSRCKVTYYCGRDCQVKHWKSGGHKEVCCKVPKTGGIGSAESRKSFVFDIDDAKPPAGPMTSMNYLTGRVSVSGVDKETRSEMKKNLKGLNVSKFPSSRNNYGDKEFIVKLQPPTRGLEAPWMCYDGPARSFQAYIPADTAGLPEVYALLQRDGVIASNPQYGVTGYKGYFNAKWEGSSVRVFYDRLVPPQQW